MSDSQHLRSVQLGFRGEHGISLVEIMVALVLSLILTAGASQIYLANKQTYRMQDAQSRLQENGRFALGIMTHDLRQAGYLGCNSATKRLSLIAKAPLIAPPYRGSGSSGAVPVLPTDVVLAAPITGGNNNTSGSFTNPSPALSSVLAGNQLGSLVRGTDAFTVQFAESCGAIIPSTSGNTASTDISGALPAGNTCDITVGAGSTTGTPVAISDCSTAHIFRAASDDSQNTLEGASTKILWNGRPEGYYPGSEILRYRAYTYFIRLNEAGQPALYRLDNNIPTGGNNPAELVEGIENLQVTYGVDLDSDEAVDQFVDADSAVMNLVVAVRLTVTVRTIEDNIASTTRSYTFNGSSASDRRLTRDFTTTVGLRNRLP